MTGTASSLNSTVSGSAQYTYDERGCLTVTSVTATDGVVPLHWVFFYNRATGIIKSGMSIKQPPFMFATPKTLLLPQSHFGM